MNKKLFKRANFEQELIEGMHKNLFSNTLEKKFSFDKIASAVDYLHNAAEILDDTGYAKQAEVITKVLESIANKHQDEEFEEEIIFEPIDLEIKPSDKEKPGANPLAVNYENQEIFEEPEFFDIKHLAFKLANKYRK